MMVKERALKKEISGGVKFSDTTGSKKYTPDYNGYRRDKRELESMPLTAEQHERAAKIAARCRRV